MLDSIHLSGADKVTLWGLVPLTRNRDLQNPESAVACEIASQIWDGSFQQFAQWMQELGCVCRKRDNVFESVRSSFGDAKVSSRGVAALAECSTKAQRIEWFAGAIDHLDLSWDRLMVLLLQRWNFQKIEPARVLADW